MDIEDSKWNKVKCMFVRKHHESENTRNRHAEMSQAVAFSSVADRFIRLYENTTKKCEEEEEEREKRRWREWREVKDSREKEFMETYISSLKDRGEFHCAEMFLNICGQ